MACCYSRIAYNRIDRFYNIMLNDVLDISIVLGYLRTDIYGID